MIPLTLAEIAGVTGGAVHDADASLVVDGDAFLDSRDPAQGGLFVAIAGEHVDGHDYAAAAVAGGAAAVLGSRSTGVPTVVVADAEAALAALASEVVGRRRTLPGPFRVVAVTGSQGKTSAKDLLAAVVAAQAPTVATRGSANNELGFPLTALRTTEETENLVLEMGARGIGHLRHLCEMVRPDVALVLNVGHAHIGEFGSQENIALAKGEIVDALPDDGLAVLNADDPRVVAMATRTTARVTTFGRDPNAELRLTGVEVDDLGRASFDLLAGDEREHVDLRVLGEHQAGNAAAAAAVAVGLGIGLSEVATALGAVRALSKWRMQLTERADGAVVINDAYNANPESMVAALETLAGIGRRTGRRTVAVLGEMRELGESSADQHHAVGRRAAELGVDVLLVVGGPARPLLDGYATAAGDRGHAEWAASADEARAWVGHNVSGSDVAVVKASRGDGLERVAAVMEQVIERPDQDQTANQPAKQAAEQEVGR